MSRRWKRHAAILYIGVPGEEKQHSVGGQTTSDDEPTEARFSPGKLDYDDGSSADQGDDCHDVVEIVGGKVQRGEDEHEGGHCHQDQEESEHDERCLTDAASDGSDDKRGESEEAEQHELDLEKARNGSEDGEESEFEKQKLGEEERQVNE